MEEKYPIRIKLLKTKDMVYFSQLDLTIILERALRRTKLTLYFTKGFRPHPKLSFKNAIKVGIEGEEEVTIYFSKPIELKKVLNSLTEQLPDGLKILQIY